jgi:feruloyl esterase
MLEKVISRRFGISRLTMASFMAAGFLSVATVSAAERTQDCSGLSDLKLDGAKITSAKAVPAGSYTQPDEGSGPHTFSGLPAFCEVKGIATPTPQSRIGFTVWLPQTANWSHRLHMVGNGGYGSNLYYAQLVARVQRGDVAVATDTGHTGETLDFGFDNREAIADWGGRSVHESVRVAKTIAAAFYGEAARYNYFSGCSTGGAEALHAAQRYPDDFDGIIAGDPGNNRTHLNLQLLWNFEHNHAPHDNSHPLLGPADLRLLHAAVLKACDKLDGVEDGVIADPRQCHFDASSLLCQANQSGGCLSAAQVDAVKALYAGPRDRMTGTQIYPGYAFGSETVGLAPNSPLIGWSLYWANPEKPDEPQRADFFRHWAFNDPSWDWWTFDWSKDVDRANQVLAPLVDAVDPDLGRFRAHGGKLIMFMGWADPVASPYEIINYYDSVVARGAGGSEAAHLADTQSFARLYMVAGMGHCALGDGATYFSNATRNSSPPVEDAQHDMGLALTEWVEHNKAPDTLIATHFREGSGLSGQVAFQRKLCVFPKTARYVSGDNNAAASFECADPK